VSSGNFAQQHWNFSFSGQQHWKPIEFVDKLHLFNFDNSLDQQLDIAQHNNQLNQSVIQHNRNALCSYREFAQQHFAEHHLSRFDDIAEHDYITEHGDTSSFGSRFSVKPNDINTASGCNHLANYNFTQHQLSRFEAAAWIKLTIAPPFA
jgi:hypothetical protein